MAFLLLNERTGNAMTTVEQNKEHMRRYFAEIVSQGNLELIPDFVAPEIIFWGPYTSEPIIGIKRFTELIAMVQAAFDDLQITVDELVVEGDTVATRWTATGVHRGEFMGTGPSGEPFRFTGTGFYRLRDGKIFEAWSLNNSIEAIRQLHNTPQDVSATSEAQNN
jgi:steroid delta-isomerase-like uncharacterized protein